MDRPRRIVRVARVRLPMSCRRHVLGAMGALHGGWADAGNTEHAERQCQDPDDLTITQGCPPTRLSAHLRSLAVPFLLGNPTLHPDL
jgi:hypothetical protein